MRGLVLYFQGHISICSSPFSFSTDHHELEPRVVSQEIRLAAMQFFFEHFCFTLGHHHLRIGTSVAASLSMTS